ncbi:Inactive serine/threonine-protein kinase TEX14 [Eufriesea mexicana]|nr:Inactive serine/threonine-protein kinase TEX14 [Eufriesea mexicana]
MTDSVKYRQGLKHNRRHTVSESYRNALQAFIDRRRASDDVEIETPSSPDKKRADILAKNNNNKCDNEKKSRESKSIVAGVPHIPAPEIFEIGWIAGTEDRYLELIFAEWQNTRVSLRRHSHPECKEAIKADLDVLSEIRHPNVLLLMASTLTDEHGLVSIFESVDCTLYHYIHDQGERISIQGIAKCGGRLSDALRHSHMRGYVHSAISSHCVYLASNGIVKLGGWELAMHINSQKPEREYEERLRTEVFRWQAPELFHRYEPHKESDVYGLALLIWEMCTMHVPWSGYTKADVERQYVHWKRGVMMDLYDFPPLLYNLLEAGLQLDINKRTLDMNRLRRFLQRLEMQYENEEPLYIDQFVNNNYETGRTYILPMKSPMGISKNKGSKLTKSVSAKQLSYSTKNSDSPPRQYLYPKKLMSKQNPNQKTTAHVEEINFFADNVKGNVRNDIQKSINILSDIENDESFKDARTNLKQLKKVLANRREHFFYGSDSSHASTDLSPMNKNKILTEAKSKDYEPHKPASHKTSLEPKYSKSPNQYDPSYLKSTIPRYRKIPYLHTPESIKNAIMQPQILNSDPQSFFETSLWRKEKLICLSKMRKMCVDEASHYLPQQTDNSDTVFTETATENNTTESVSMNNNNTYVIKEKSEATEIETSQEDSTQVTENTNDSVTPVSPHSEPLQVLKDALDRATEIVRSITPNTNESCPSPSFKSYQDFEVTVDNNQANKFIFEDLYDLQINDNEEIKSIERSTAKNKTFLFDNSNVNSTITSNETQNESNNNIVISIASVEKCSHSFDPTCNRNFVCESIAEVSSEFNNLSNDTMSDRKEIEPLNDKIISIEENAKVLETVQNHGTLIDQSNLEIQTKIHGKNEQKSATKNFDLMFMNDATKNKNCKTCYQSALPRRRSLPAALSQLRSVNNSALGKLPIRRGDIPDNTVEDLYIDDEFGDNLNINMVLLDEDLSVDEDFLSKISDL